MKFLHKCLWLKSEIFIDTRYLTFVTHKIVLNLKYSAGDLKTRFCLILLISVSTLMIV